MTIAKAFTIVASFAFLSTAIGAGVGYCLGAFTPDFISAILRDLPNDANLVQIGLGLGIVNGGLVGIAVGVLVMGTLAWYELRRQSQ